MTAPRKRFEPERRFESREQDLLVPAARIEPAMPRLRIGRREKPERIYERKRLNGFDVINRERTWHPWHLPRLSMTRQNQVPQNFRKHLISRARARPNHQQDSHRPLVDGLQAIVTP